MITTKFEDLIHSALKQLSALGFGEDTVHLKMNARPTAIFHYLAMSYNRYTRKKSS